MKTVIVRVPIETIQNLKEKYPELANETNATTVRIALLKLLEEK